MAINQLTSAIFTLLNPIRATFHMQAPQDQPLPFFVVQVIGGGVAYCFGADAIEQPRVQITQYYEWTGQTDQAITDNEAIVAALDRQTLTADGIMMQRLAEPMLTVQEGRVLQVVQDWQFEYLS